MSGYRKGEKVGLFVALWLALPFIWIIVAISDICKILRDPS